MRHAATVLLCSGLCHGGIITVPTEAQSIQEAIEASVNGDSIHVLPGMYNEAINLRGKAITLASTDGCAHTVIDAGEGDVEALPGYQPLKAMVFSGIYPVNPDMYEELRDALERLKLN